MTSKRPSKAELDALASGIADLRAAADAVGKRAGELQARIETLSQDARKHQQEAEETRTRLADLDRRFRELSGRWTEAIAEDVGRLDRSERELRRLQALLKETADARDAIRKENALLQVRVADLETQLKTPTPSPAPAPVETSPPAAEPAVLVVPSEPAAEPGPAPAEPPSVPSLEPAPEVVAEPAEVAQAAANPKNVFGPAGDDGNACYVLLDVISRDAMGGVYRAYDRTAHEYVAVRFVAGQAGDQLTAAIEEELHKLIGLPHPNSLQVRGIGRRGTRLCVTMELVDARPLGQAKIEEVSRVCRIVRDAADALHYAHEEGILHGAINPENILVDARPDGDHAYVRDFALAHLLETVATGSTAPGLMIRDPAYLPPEQIKDVKRTRSVAADIYGLGATLYAALAGKPPFEGKDLKQVQSRVMIEEPAPLEVVRPAVPGPLGAIVRRAMAKDRGNRYASAKEMSEALSRYLEGAGTRVRVRPGFDLRPT